MDIWYAEPLLASIQCSSTGSAYTATRARRLPYIAGGIAIYSAVRVYCGRYEYRRENWMGKRCDEQTCWMLWSASIDFYSLHEHARPFKSHEFMYKHLFGGWYILCVVSLHLFLVCVRALALCCKSERACRWVLAAVRACACFKRRSVWQW